MRLVLVRHGDAHAGFQGIIGGHRGCAGLTPLGRRQAQALRDHIRETGRIRADVLFASELPRAIETASIIAPALGMETFGQECDLCELHPGEGDGLTWTEYAARYGSFDMQAEPDRVFAPGGDSWTTFHDRVERILGKLANEFPNETVVAVCHAGVIVASLRVLLGIRNQANDARMQPTNTGLTEWEFNPVSARWTLHTFNDASHLLRLGPESGASPERGG